MSVKNVYESMSEMDDLRNRGREFQVEINTPSNDIKEIQINANKLLHFFLESNKTYILSKLSKIKGLERVAESGKSLFSTLEEYLEYSLDKLILQELLVLDESTLEAKIGNPISEKTIEKMIKGLLINYFFGLNEVQKNNLNSTQSKYFLKNLYKISPDAVSKLLEKFSGSELPRYEIILYATITPDADKILSKALEDFKALEKEFVDNSYITKSIILRCVFSNDPRAKLIDILETIEEMSKENPDLDISTIKNIVVRYKGSSKEINKQYKKKLNYILSLDTDIPLGVVKYFALIAKDIDDLKKIIEDCLNTYEILSQKYPEFKFYIRAHLHVDRSLIEKNIQKIIKTVDEVYVNPKLPQEFKFEKSFLKRCCVYYGSQDLLNDLIKISKYYQQIKNYFYENDEIFREIYDNFKTEIINIDLISPRKTLDENKEFFAEKLNLFKSLLSEMESRYGTYKKRNQKENQGYIKFLIDSLYFKNPKEYLKSKGFDI